MATLGNVPAEAYTNTVKDSFSGNGSTTAFTMSLPTVTNDVRVVVENVIQDPTVAYSVSGTTLTFTSAPPSGTNNIYVVHLGPAVMTTVPPAEIADATTFASSLTVQGAFTSPGIDDNADAVALTIDSNENILAGKSTQTIDTIGVELLGSLGKIHATRDGGASAGFNRKTSDGDIAVFYKDGSTVGSIYNGGGNLGVNSSGGLLLVDDIITPTSGADATHDIGRSSARYKDLYLSGGVYLGGTGAANYLSDYETGVFTPTVTWQSGSPSYVSQGRYTKVGNIVTVRTSIQVSASGGSGVVSIQNLPFTAYTIIQTASGAERGNTGKSIVVWIDSASTRLNMRYYDYSDVGANGDIMIVSATYQAA